MHCYYRREWRCIGNFSLPTRYLVIAPEADHEQLKEHMLEWLPRPGKIKLIDAFWGLETMIARLAGYPPEDL